MGAAKRTLLQFPSDAAAQVSPGEEQPAEASAVRSRRSVDPHSMLLSDADEFEPESLEVAKTPWWIKLAVVAAASAVSVTVAVAFRPKLDLATASAPRADAATPVAATVSGSSAERAQGTAASPALPTAASSSPTPQRAVPGAHPAHRAGVGRKQPGVRSSLKPHRAGEIVDPWGK